MSDRDDLIGIRPEDLSAEDADAQRKLLESDVGFARAHRDAFDLGATLANLPRLDGPSVDLALSHRGHGETRSRPARGWLWAAVMLAAASALVVPKMMMNPHHVAEGAVHVAALVHEGRVRFLVDVEEPGYLVLLQEGHGSVNGDGPTWVEAGVYEFGPDDGLKIESDGPAQFRAMLCEDPADVDGAPERCASYTVTLEQT